MAKDIEMYTLSIALGSTSWALLFKTKEAAELALDRIMFAKGGTVSTVDFSDDFGQRIFVEGNSIHGCMLEDMDKTPLAHIERALWHARMQAQGQKLAQSDASLRQPGPAILSPGMGMANGPFGRTS
jgi:hypothetical protein